MVKQEKNYIKRQKKKYLLAGIIWSIIVLIIFGTGLLLTKTRANLFTVFACVIAIVASLFITRFISFCRYHDCDEACAESLESMSGDYALYHSAIIPSNKGTAYFEHVAVTSQAIYFISYTKEQVMQYRTWIIEGLGSKGIGASHVHFIVAKDLKQMEQHVTRLQKTILDHPNSVHTDQAEEKGRLEEYSNRMNEILM